MILSNVSIHKALDSGWLIINPEPVPRFPEDGADCPYQTSSVDLQLADEIAYFKEDMAFNIDLTQGDYRRTFGQNSENRKITTEQPYRLLPHKMVIGQMLERVHLPLIDDAPCLAARIEGKSSYARCGLLVHFTAPTIHAGYDGPITLELINLGTIPIMLHPHKPICQLIVEQVDGRPFRNDSQFQSQATVAGMDG
ncbi:MAG: dCTP deaminase [Planctomycetes bacterium]|nr:dCTP deaminase [Planctomycetota bacterium]